MPFAWQLVKHQIEVFGGHCEPRLNANKARLNANKDGLAVTSHGSLVLDAHFDNVDANTLNEKLNSISGVVEHGIFYHLATKILCGSQGVVQVN
jgi:ribose 5-phosphate isomerase A